jgi:hypothetical protein
VLFLLVIAGAAIFTQKTDGQTNNTITQQWLDQALVQWKPSQNASMSFQVLFNRASYGNLETSYNTAAVQEADLSMLESTNAQCVRIDLGYAPWLQNDQAAITEMTSLVQSIKAAGKCLVIADASSESYRGGGAIPWTQFQQAWVQRVSTLASLYHPDYYVVIKEPGWYVPMVSDAKTSPAFQNLTSWIGLTQTLASTVISASPNTKVGVSVAADSLASNPSDYIPYLTGVEKLSGISFLGFDVYDPAGFTSTQSFLTQYGAGGKDVWIAEAWSGDGTSVFDASRAQLDAEWMRVLYYFAQEEHAVAVMPFYTDLFSSYSLTGTGPTDSAQIISLYQQRTPVFSEFQAVIATSSGSSSTVASTTSSTASLKQSSPGSSSSSSTTTQTTSTPQASSTGSRASSSTSASPSKSLGSTQSTTTPAAGGGGTGFFSTRVVALEVVVLVGIFAAVLYYRRRQ